MRTRTLIGIVSLAALAGCGLEGLFANVGRSAYSRPASKIDGKAPSGATSMTLVALDGSGAVVTPFQTSVSAGGYEMRLPSATYSMIRAQGTAGNLALRAIVPSIGEEATAAGVDLDARNVTETLLVEAAASAAGLTFAQLTPEAYVGDGVTSGTRTLIRRDLDQAGPTRNLLLMVETLMSKADFASGATTPDLFAIPVLDPQFAVTTSALSASWLVRNQIDYAGPGPAFAPAPDGIVDDTSAFDATLAAAARLYKPEGCPDPANVRVVFTVDFNDGALDGNCSVINRFKWATDKPGKSMFFVGWIHRDSANQDPAANALLGGGVPNQIPMYDDGTHGDEVAGDGIWTVAFRLPRGLRVGYKYTWGTRGALWTGTEEWPGNSRLIELDDVNGDAFVYRRDVFGDEATNKDLMNLNIKGTGSITWTTDLRGCGIPEAREQKVVFHNACSCDGEWITPRSIGPVTVACTQ